MRFSSLSMHARCKNAIQLPLPRLPEVQRRCLLCRIVFRRDAVIIAGEVKFFESKGDSGKRVWRGFCPNCGSQLFGKVEILPTLIAIRAGTLDDPSEFKPKANIYARHAPHWDHLDQDLVIFPESPPLR